MNSSNASKLRQMSLAMLLACVVCPATCMAWSLASQPVEGILVLRNGNLLRGKVQQLGDHYHVYLPNGELRIRKQQVEMVCQNIEEAYQRRREARVNSTADSHFELASWCLRHDLFGHAEAELRDAQATDPKHPRLALLQRQLKHSLHLEQRTKQLQQAAAKVVPEPVPLDPAALEKAPKWARALFVRQIQPLVVHSCATSGCHQSAPAFESQPEGKSHFHLNRLALDGAGHPEVTLRNLAAMLQQIDWQAADQSKLLLRARQAHGSLNASTPLPPHKLQVLEGWVEQLAEAHRKENELKTLPPVVEIAKQSSRPTLRLIPPQQKIQQPTSTIHPASYESEVESEVESKAEAVDPFDPSIFNRRYATAKKPAESLVEKSAKRPAEKPNAELGILHDSVPHASAPGEPVFIPQASATE